MLTSSGSIPRMDRKSFRWHRCVQICRMHLLNKTYTVSLTGHLTSFKTHFAPSYSPPLRFAHFWKNESFLTDCKSPLGPCKSWLARSQRAFCRRFFKAAQTWRCGLLPALREHRRWNQSANLWTSTPHPLSRRRAPEKLRICQTLCKWQPIDGCHRSYRLLRRGEQEIFFNVVFLDVADVSPHGVHGCLNIAVSDGL